MANAHRDLGRDRPIHRSRTDDQNGKSKNKQEKPRSSIRTVGYRSTHRILGELPERRVKGIDILAIWRLTVILSAFGDQTSVNSQVTRDEISNLSRTV